LASSPVERSCAAGAAPPLPMCSMPRTFPAVNACLYPAFGANTAGQRKNTRLDPG
jgi:hypothetical protein